MNEINGRDFCERLRATVGQSTSISTLIINTLGGCLDLHVEAAKVNTSMLRSILCPARGVDLDRWDRLREVRLYVGAGTHGYSRVLLASGTNQLEAKSVHSAP